MLLQYYKGKGSWEYMPVAAGPCSRPKLPRAEQSITSLAELSYGVLPLQCLQHVHFAQDKAKHQLLTKKSCWCAAAVLQRQGQLGTCVRGCLCKSLAATVSCPMLEMKQPLTLECCAISAVQNKTRFHIFQVTELLL